MKMIGKWPLPNEQGHPSGTGWSGLGAIGLLVLACVWGITFATSLCLGAGEASSTSNRAGASQGHRNVEALPYGRFVVAGTNGYRVLVAGTPRAVRLVAWRGHATAQYIATAGRADESGIEASFGRLGSVSVRFRASGRKAAKPPPGDLQGCRSVGESLDRLGVFVGRIDFRGEHGFTRLRLRRASGRAAPSRTLSCPRKTARGTRKPAVDPRAPRIRAVSFLGSFYVGAGAFSESGLNDKQLPLGIAKLRPGGVPFSAEVSELRGGLLINRVVVARGPRASFTSDIPQRTGTISPPSPFKGTASLSNCPSPSWRGSLAVSFPGREVRLTQRPFSNTAVLLPARRCPDDR